ncbi:hypothetical protein DFP87_1184 [Achromobacter marplatensis]|uniref:Uncharacterized protein n=1 Tax=Achromobacter marplatensis TaxID=470868 RepID=A0ABX9G2P5_9BURK|nr:hypothetical protein DFP87_1184 [Achromobacter marplatensis]CAB3704839.1 hypothetical protein LMG26219_05567 [Achromobacter marplatensis]
MISGTVTCLLSSTDSNNINCLRPLSTFVRINLKSYFCPLINLTFINYVFIKKEQILAFIPSYKSIPFQREETLYRSHLIIIIFRLSHNMSLD